MDSLFDEPEESDWEEVPQARFLSWSDDMQRSYCERRDVDSALTTDDPWWAEFFLARSKQWKSSNVE